jgi:hypothetical protein
VYSIYWSVIEWYPVRGTPMPSQELALLRLMDEFHALNLAAAASLRRGFVDMARARCTAGTRHAFGARYLPAAIAPTVKLEEEGGERVLSRIGRGGRGRSRMGNAEEKQDGLRKRRGNCVPSTPSAAVREEDTQQLQPRRQQAALLFGPLTPRALTRSGENFASTIETLIALANLKRKMRKILLDKHGAGSEE